MLAHIKLIVVVAAFSAASSGASFYVGQQLLLANKAALCGPTAAGRTDHEFFAVPPAPMTGNKRY